MRTTSNTPTIQAGTGSTIISKSVCLGYKKINNMTTAVTAPEAPSAIGIERRNAVLAAVSAGRKDLARTIEDEVHRLQI